MGLTLLAMSPAPRREELLLTEGSPGSLSAGLRSLTPKVTDLREFVSESVEFSLSLLRGDRERFLDPGEGLGGLKELNEFMSPLRESQAFVGARKPPLEMVSVALNEPHLSWSVDLRDVMLALDCFLAARLVSEWAW